MWWEESSLKFEGCTFSGATIIEVKDKTRAQKSTLIPDVKVNPGLPYAD